MRRLAAGINRRRSAVRGRRVKGKQLRVVAAVAAAVAVLGGADASPGAGEPWARQSPLPTGFSLEAVDMVSTTEAWAVGDVGTILHTTDGGASWQKEASGTQERLDAVRFKDALHGWAVGTNLALFTVDGGVTWAPGTGIVGSPVSVDCSTVTTCFVGYGYSTASKTTDGGRTWNEVTLPFAVGRFQFFDSQKGIASGPGGVLATNDGGASWSPRPGPHGGFFVSQQEGWRLSGATAEHTTDGGASWQAQTLPPNSRIYASTFVDARNGWGVGSEENIVHTSDGGQTWTTQRGGVGSGARYPFWDVDFVDALHGIVVGGAGKIYTTSDGGATWTLRTSGAATETLAMDRVGDRLWAVGTDAIVQTSTNGGAFWQEETRIPVESGNLPDVDFVDALTGWTVLDGSAGPGRGRVFKSTDGGRTWQNQGLDDSGRLGGVVALDANVVIAVGVYFPVIMRSADGGQTWQYRDHQFFCTNSCGYAWYGIDSPDGQNVWVTGEQGIILHSADRGLTWETQRVGEPWEELMDVHFADAQNGWAVGWQGTILRTTDGGRTWIKKDPGLGYTGAVLTVCPLSANVAWVGGYDAFAARTTDGGLTWQRERVDMESTWIHSWGACTFIDSENGWFGGYTGIFRRTGAASPPPPPVVKPLLTNLALTPSTVEGGARASGTVTLDSAAPEGGVDVALATDTPSYSSVPASVTVLPGQTSASFTVQSFPVGANVVATISAVYDGVTKRAQLTIQPAPAATDRVGVTRAEYTVQKRELRIEATSTSASATLRVSVTSTGALIGTLRKLGGSRHAGQFAWPSNPESVTVRSTAGGSASATVVAK
jgi:photosystem II stability/assembly factor-like uncharacterized protein